jgi:hypothetical protein
MPQTKIYLKKSRIPRNFYISIFWLSACTMFSWCFLLSQLIIFVSLTSTDRKLKACVVVSSINFRVILTVSKNHRQHRKHAFPSDAGYNFAYASLQFPYSIKSKRFWPILQILYNVPACDGYILSTWEVFGYPDQNTLGTHCWNSSFKIAWNSCLLNHNIYFFKHCRKHTEHKIVIFLRKINSRGYLSSFLHIRRENLSWQTVGFGQLINICGLNC